LSIATEEYQVVNYNPTHYIPITEFQNRWHNMKMDGVDRVEDPYGRNPAASNFSAGIASSAPFIILASMMVILVNGMTVRTHAMNASLGEYLSNPTMIFALVAFIVSFTYLRKKMNFAVKLRKAADFAVLESARRYLTQRYETLPENWEDRFVSYLVEEEVPENRFSEKYELTVRPYKGYRVIMVANINGEAPQKN
jgi:hypothetical protein